MIPEMLRQEIAANSLCDEGRGIPALRGKQTLSLGFLGGSVTCGYVTGQGCGTAYPALFADALRNEGYCITETVCAAPGMDSMLGNLLADDMILAHQPDLIVLDFAINETTLRPSVMTFESLVRKLLNAPWHPVVCLLLLRSAHGYSCEGFMEPIAAHYQLPCINLKNGLDPAITRGDLTFADYGDMESHPTPDGQQLLADCLLHLFHSAENAQIRQFPLPEPWLAAPHETMRFRPVSGKHVTGLPMPFFPKAICISRETGAWEITLKCRTICIVYAVHNLPELGSACVHLDGQPVKEPVLHSDSLYGWGNAKHRIVLQTAEADMHTLRIEPYERGFMLLGLGICE